MKITTILSAAMVLSVAYACKSPASAASDRKSGPTPPPLVAATAPDGVSGASRIIGGTPPPRAVVYRTNGDYRDNVPVNVSAAGVLLSYPAPADVRGAEPVALADGYLLDRRGVGDNTVFTRYTYSEYGALSEAPQPEEIEESIIAGSRVTKTIVLPMTVDEALADTAAVNAFILQR